MTRSGQRTWLLGVMALVVAGHAAGAGQSGPGVKRVVPVDAFSAILDAFQSHSIVALGEGPHGNEQGHAFRLALIRDPRFTATVNDLVVEFGSGRYQELMDRFVGGESVSDEELRHVWQDTTVVGSAWDRPIYEEFFRAIRALNVSLTAQRRLRVLLGDTPIDWSRVRTREQKTRWTPTKSRYTADLILKEVLAKKRRALVIYGDSHLQGRGLPDDRLIINIIERSPSHPRVFTISTGFLDPKRIQDDVSSWPVPSLAALRGTAVGSRPLASFYQIPPAPGWHLLRMEDQYDAMLHLGPPGSMTMSRLTAEQCADTNYLKMRLGRMALGVVQVRQAGMNALQQYCASLAPKPANE